VQRKQEKTTHLGSDDIGNRTKAGAVAVESKGERGVRERAMNGEGRRKREGREEEGTYKKNQTISIIDWAHRPAFVVAKSSAPTKNIKGLSTSTMVSFRRR